ncbi:hypothetical protein RJP56_01255 [Shewanella baltica]|uniref:hypothetical protein n=1 Tax=Shewanella TaxID=22 RepID=UPI00287123BF|nr:MULTISPECIES: hypothetical protein [Shewanella]MDR9764682.1 hypothetical protein [Shewanella baltica]MDT3334374.1 hypothetical protein [Shewanella sp. SP1S1-7]
MNHKSILLALTFATMLLGGCATKMQAVVPLDSNMLKNKDVKVGVIMSDVAVPETYITGADCLLCYAAASAANSSLDSHLKTIPVDDIKNLKSEITQLMLEKGISAVALEGEIEVGELKKTKSQELNTAPRDYSIYKTKDINYLLVIEVYQVGAYRTYSSYIPTMDPVASFSGVAYIVDLSNNKYILYKPFSNRKASDLEWDEPPTFPGLTNSLYEVIATGKDAIKANLTL